MDLLGLGGYGSDAEDDDAEEQQQQQRLPDKQPAGPMPAAQAPAEEDDEDAGAGGDEPSLFAKLPPPSAPLPGSSQVPDGLALLGLAPAPPSSSSSAARSRGDAGAAAPSASRVPEQGAAPTSKVRKVIKRQLPVHKLLLEKASELEKEEEEDEGAARAKRARTSGGRARLLDFLPPPQRDGGSVDLGGGVALGGGRRMGGAGGGAAAFGEPMPEPKGVPGGFFQGGAGEDDDDDLDPGPVPEQWRPEPADGDGDADDVPGAAVGDDTDPLPTGPEQYTDDADAPQYGEEQYGIGSGGQYAGGRAPGAAAVEPDLMEEALRLEMERAARQGGGFKLVEINANDIHRSDSHAANVHGGVQAALGAEYAAQLRSSSQAFQGDKLARRKHQIGTLFANAKLRELELLEKKGSGMKTKSETQSKYGW